MFSVSLTVPTLSDAAAVVAPEVEQLGVLGAFLLVGQQFGSQCGILFRRGAALAGTGDWADGDAVAFEADEDFRRSADDMEILEIEVEHVGRRVQAAQRAVERHRAGVERLGHALREDDLHDVAFGDVVLGFEYGLLERCFAEGGNGRPRSGPAVRLGMHNWRAQLAEQFLQACPRLLVGAGEAGFGIDDQRQLAGDVVDDGDFLGEQQADVRRADVVRFVGAGQLGFDIAHGVVAEAADQAAAEARQAGTAAAARKRCMNLPMKSSGLVSSSRSATRLPVSTMHLMAV